MSKFCFITQKHNHDWYLYKKEQNNLLIIIDELNTKKRSAYKFVNYQEKYHNTNVNETKNKNENGDKNDECSICLEVIDKSKKKNNESNLDDGFVTKCGHTFHKKCIALTLINDMYNQYCPICRTDILSEK